MPTVQARWRLRQNTTAGWAASTTPLLLGELGADVTTGELKLGNGTDLWAGLPAITGGGGGTATAHNDLTGKSAADQHPMSAITGLVDAIDTVEAAVVFPAVVYPTEAASLGIDAPTTLGDLVEQVYTSGLLVYRIVDDTSLPTDPLKSPVLYVVDYRGTLASNELGSSGINSVLFYGSATEAAGGFANAQGVTVVVRNSSDDANEVAGNITAIQVGEEDDLTDQTAVSMWGASYTLRGPIGIRPGFLGGQTVVAQNFYDGTGARSRLYGFAAVNHPGIGDGNDFFTGTPGVGPKYEDTHPVDFGFVVAGASGPWETAGDIGYRVAFRAGGWVTPWRGDYDPDIDDAAALAAWHTKIGRVLQGTDWVEGGILIDAPHADALDTVSHVELVAGATQTGPVLKVTDGTDDLAGINPDGTIFATVEAPTAVLTAGMVNSWTTEVFPGMDIGFLRYYKHAGHGYAEFRLGGGASGTAAAVLPVGYRPAVETDTPAYATDGADAGAGLVTVATNGDFTLTYPTGLGVLSGRASWRLA